MSATTSDFLRQLRTLAARQAMGGLSDQQLLERFRLEHSEASFAVLVQRHGPMVLSVCRRVLHHVQDAEDAFQATFLVLAKKAATLRQPPLLGAWLHGVAYHVALRLKAKTQRRAAHECCVDPQPPGDAMDDITWRELRSVLDEELQRLPEKYRAPLVLCYLEARTQDEAARHLGWSKNTFGRRMNQARQMLARRLTRRGLTLPAAVTAPLLIDGAATAAVPPLLAANTVRAGLAWASGQPADALASASAVALAESGGKALLVSKAKWALVLLLALSGAASGVLTHQILATKPAAPQPAARQTKAVPPPARSASKDQAIEIKGRVLDPDGKPVAGARLLLRSDTVQKRAETDQYGKFCFTASPADFGPQGKGVLIATAKGFGLDWIDIRGGDKNEEIMLRLVADDVPIGGRVLDLEGRPVAGVTVDVRSVSKRPDGSDLASWVQDCIERHSRRKGYSREGVLKTLPLRGLDLPASVMTGSDGRFRLTGFGRERVLNLAIHGPTICQTRFDALTHSGPAKGWIPGHFGIYACRFDYVAAPCKPIIGTVRDKRTGKPLAGITVWVSQRMLSESKTDSQGHYRIVGAAKSKEYNVGAAGMPYFNHPKHHIADTPGLEPITVDFELEQGIVVRGQLTEKSTGKPVQGEVYYTAEPDNPHLKDYADAKYGTYVIPRTAPDGSFAVTVIPGPGLLQVQADDINRFAQAEENNPFQTFHAVVPINPSEKDPKSLTCGIALEPARVLKGLLIGPDGKAVTGAYAAGLSSIVTHDVVSNDKLESDTFTVAGMKPSRPRTVVFFHAEKRIGKVVKLRGDETKPLLVRLEPVAAVSGRILDAKGRPWAGLQVIVYLANKGGNDTMTNQMFYTISSWPKLTQRQTTTDREGKFRLEGLVPDMKYILIAREEGSPPGTDGAYEAEGYVTAESGKTKDLGDLKSKQFSGEPAKE